MDRENFAFRWADREGLIMRHPQLNAMQIVERYQMRVIECGCEGLWHNPGCYGWRLEKLPPKRS